jgi:hypothetical protein
MHPVTISHPSNDAAPESEAWVNPASVRPGSKDGRIHDEFRLEDEVAGLGR